MPRPVLGTAHLFATVDAARSAEVLATAWQVGFRAFDTSPFYGHGRSEPALGRFLAVADRRAHAHVVSKVGLWPAPPPGAATRAAKALARRLPGPLRERLRGESEPHGSFTDVAALRASLSRSRARLGGVDRLMLHEVHAADLSADVLAFVRAVRDTGEAPVVGVATANARAGAALAVAPELLSAAHLEVGPFAAPVELPAGVTTVLGHGALGPGGAALAGLRAQLAADPVAASHWASASAGTAFAGPDGLAEALVARAAAGGGTGRVPDELVVATSRPDRLPRLLVLAAGEVPLPPAVAAALDVLLTAPTGRD